MKMPLQDPLEIEVDVVPRAGDFLVPVDPDTRKYAVDRRPVKRALMVACVRLHPASGLPLVTAVPA